MARSAWAPADRAALARAFTAKAVLGIPQTNMLIERLQVDKSLRRLCGWEYAGAIPSEATFSRAFAEFAHSRLPTRVHEALIKKTHEQRLVGHISRDATAIVVATIVATAAALGACRQHVTTTPPKLGAADTAVEMAARV